MNVNQTPLLALKGEESQYGKVHSSSFRFDGNLISAPLFTCFFGYWRYLAKRLESAAKGKSKYSYVIPKDGRSRRERVVKKLTLPAQVLKKRVGLCKRILLG